MKKFGTWRENNHKYFKKNFPAGKDVVDLGAGESPFWDIFSQSKTYTGVDWKPSLKVSVVADLTKKIPLNDNSYDVAILSNVLEHTPEPLHLFLESYRLLKENGVLIGTVPFIRDIHQASHDFYRYTPYAIKLLLEKAKFTDVEIESLGTIRDVFYLNQQLFFSYFLDSNSSWKIRLARKIYFVLEKLMRPIFSKSPKNDKFTEGYGFKARKQSF